MKFATFSADEKILIRDKGDFSAHTKPPDKEKLFFLAKKAFAGSYSDPEIDKWLTLFLKRFFASQFKRSCIPDGPKVGSVSLSPRGDWRMPSDADRSVFL